MGKNRDKKATEQTEPKLISLREWMHPANGNRYVTRSEFVALTEALVNDLRADAQQMLAAYHRGIVHRRWWRRLGRAIARLFTRGTAEVPFAQRPSDEKVQAVVTLHRSLYPADAFTQDQRDRALQGMLRRYPLTDDEIARARTLLGLPEQVVAAAGEAADAGGIGPQPKPDERPAGKGFRSSDRLQESQKGGV